MLALILDRTHAVLLDRGRLPRVPHDGSARPLRPIEALLAGLGLGRPAPAGSRPAADGAGGRDFVFIVDRVAAPEGMAWQPLRDVSADDELWSLYVERVLGGHEP